MGIRTSILAILLLAASIVASVYFSNDSSVKPVHMDAGTADETIAMQTSEEKPDVVQAPTEQPPVVAENDVPPEDNSMPAAGLPKPIPKTVRRARPNQNEFWERQEQIFNKHRELLEQDENPSRRREIIDTLASYVRIDTMEALNWAMALENPDEQRAALEAINKYALSGIGARIEVDQTGLPKIRETTVLGGAASTGNIEVGDYISGIVNSDGSTTYFNGLPISRISQMLRGKPGSEVQLVMHRISEDGGGAYLFNVPVQRSLIVVEPPDH